MLGEAEWEYVARAETNTVIGGGIKSPSETKANYGGLTVRNYRTVKLVIRPNAFGDYMMFMEMSGNGLRIAGIQITKVLPSDGRAWLSSDGGDCSRRVLRGGSWYNEPVLLRSANRGRDTSTDRSGLSVFVSPERLVQRVNRLVCLS